MISGEIHKQVGVYLPKGIDVVCADYGILYSGNYFLNMDVKAARGEEPEYLKLPAARSDHHQPMLRSAV